ncbi:MAG TPA: hypothetical protein PKA39_12335, partial [Ignavibacteria bacterium]|nr:hypothetical protein [Ignavibacteria bacterium]
MKTKFLVLFLIAAISGSFLALNYVSGSGGPKSEADTLIIEGEKHFKNLKMLTNGGENAEAYFSFD